MGAISLLRSSQSILGIEPELHVLLMAENDSERTYLDLSYLGATLSSPQ